MVVAPHYQDYPDAQDTEVEKNLPMSWSEQCSCCILLRAGLILVAKIFAALALNMLIKIALH